MSSAPDLLELLAAPEHRENPYPLLATLRQAAPVYRSRAGFYVITRHDDAVRALLGAGRDFLGAASPTSHLSLSLRRNSLPGLDPPTHGRLRSAVATEFHPRLAEEYRHRTEHACTKLLDTMADRLDDGETIDLNAEFSVPLSVAASADVIGIPESDRCWLEPTVHAVALAFEGAPEPQLNAADSHAARLHGYLLDLIRERRRAAADDLVSNLAKTTQLTDEDIIHTLWGVWSGALLPVSAGVNQAVHAMLTNPSTACWLEQEHATARAFTAEALRWDGVVLFGAYPRIAARDMRIADMDIPAGSDVRPMIASANRDPDAFDNPDEFNPRRDTAASLAFGVGRHACLAKALAYSEIAAAVRCLHQRFPTLRMAGAPLWTDHVRVRLMRRFPVALATTRL